MECELIALCDSILQGTMSPEFQTTDQQSTAISRLIDEKHRLDSSPLLPTFPLPDVYV